MSADRFRLKRGTTTQVSAYLPQEGEPVVDLTTMSLKIGDGVTQGGVALNLVASAVKLATARSINLTGDATGSVTFDGSSNVSTALTLADTGVAAATYARVTVDSKGRVTNGAVTLPITAGGTGSTTATAALTALGGAPLVSPAFTGTPTTPTPTFNTEGSLVAPMASVGEAKQTYRGDGMGYTTSTTLTTDSLGRWHRAGTSGITLTLPPKASVSSGKTLTIHNSSAGVVTIKGNGAELIALYGGGSNTLALAAAEWVEIVYNPDALYVLKRGKYTETLDITNKQAWTTYTPTVAATTGTYTTTSVTGKYMVAFGVCNVQIRLTITTKGTGMYPVISLPVAALNGSALMPLLAMESVVNAKLGTAQIQNSLTTVTVRDYSNADLVTGDGCVVTIQGSYPVA